MLNLQAALGTSQIDQLENFIETKTKNYKIYKEEFEKTPKRSIKRFLYTS